MTPRLLRLALNLWPPFFFAGIRVLEIADGWRFARVQLRFAWFNRNYVGTHYGGNLFSMTDPFWMVLVRESLGRDYIVWDQAGEITFVKPGREPVYAEFHVEESALDELRTATRQGDKHLKWFSTEIKTRGGDLVARVRKQIYVRRKDGRTNSPRQQVKP